MHRDSSDPPEQTAAIVAGCDHAPAERVCGVPRRERLERDLARKGYRLTDDPTNADRVVADCRVMCGDDELHLCELGKRAVEKRLLASLRKDIDGVISRSMNRPVSLAFTRLLMNTSIKPNHVTLFIMLVGISSGFVVAQGGYWYGVLGALLLNTQSVLDGTDGELARLKYQGSHFGQWFDTLSDDLSNLSFLVGATYAASYEPIAFVGAAGIAAFVIGQAVVYYALITVYKSGNLQHFEWDIAGGEGGLLSRVEFMVKRDFFCFAFVILALFGEVGIYIAICGASAGALITFVTLAVQLMRYGLVPPSKARARAANVDLEASSSGTALATRDL